MRNDHALILHPNEIRTGLYFCVVRAGPGASGTFEPDFLKSGRERIPVVAVEHEPTGCRGLRLGRSRVADAANQGRTISSTSLASR